MELSTVMIYPENGDSKSGNFIRIEETNKIHTEIEGERDVFPIQDFQKTLRMTKNKKVQHK